MKGRYSVMKKITALFLAMLLTLSLAGGAFAAGETFTTRYFTLELPEGWIIDTEDLEDESEEGLEVLGYFGGPEETALEAAALLVYYDELKDFSSWSASEEEIEEYKEILMEEYEEDDPEFLGTLMAGSIPFILIRCTDEDGDYLYADTVTNGNSIQFEAYLTDGENFFPMTDETIEQFKTILATFKPV